MRIILASLLFLPISALAQEAPPNQAAQMQALSQRVMQEIQANVGCSAQVITLRQELAQTQAEIKRLTDKYEPKKEPEAKK